MKTTSLFLLVTALAAVSCKKSKDPGPKIIEFINADLQTYYEFSGFNGKNTTWFYNDKKGSRSMEQITADKKLQNLVFFGFYEDKQGWGLYSPAVYPVLYGQEKWAMQNNTIFRKPAFTQKEFQEYMEDDTFSVTDAFIRKSFTESMVIGNKVTKVEEGDVYMFETMGGKYKGMIKVHNYSDYIQALILQVWVIQ